MPGIRIPLHPVYACNGHRLPTMGLRSTVAIRSALRHSVIQQVLHLTKDYINWAI